MADFTSRQKDEQDTRGQQLQQYTKLGHQFPGGLMCCRCEMSIRTMQVLEAEGREVPRCPNARVGQAEIPHPPAKSGSKYHRQIFGLLGHGVWQGPVTVDVYSVLTAFAVTSPGLQHAAKKILCAGIRGKGDRLQDLREARDALGRAIEDAEREVGNG